MGFVDNLLTSPALFFKMLSGNGAQLKTSGYTINIVCDKQRFDTRRKRMSLFTAVCFKISCVEVSNVLDRRQHEAVVAVYLSRLLSLKQCRVSSSCTVKLICWVFFMARE